VSGDTTAYDLTINKFSGNLDNGVGFDNKSWSFDGTNQKIDFNQPPILDVLPRTISIWFNPSLNNRSFYTRGGSRGNQSTRDIDVYGNGSLLISMAVNNTTTNYSLTTPFPTLNEWHEVVTTWDGTTATDGAKLYLNGELVDTQTAVSAQQLYRFDHFLGGDGAFIFNGDISNFKYYIRALTADEVSQNYNALKWRFI
jgi:hypothetical protein